MLSNLELRHIIESAFPPCYCTCRPASLGFLQGGIADPVKGRIELHARNEASVTTYALNQQVAPGIRL